MTESPFEVEQRKLARIKFEAGELRAALHVWDTLEYPELLSEEDVVLFETARQQVRGT